MERPTMSPACNRSSATVVPRTNGRGESASSAGCGAGPDTDYQREFEEGGRP